MPDVSVLGKQGQIDIYLPHRLRIDLTTKVQQQADCMQINSLMYWMELAQVTKALQDITKMRLKATTNDYQTYKVLLLCRGQEAFMVQAINTRQGSEGHT